MNSRYAQGTRGRAGFTLIELLVVIFLIGFLAALAVVIGPALINSDPASRGAQQLQSNLFVAKQQALRDGNPYGIRLLPDSQGNYTSFQFIQQPNDFIGGAIQVTATPGPPPANTVTFNGVDYTGGLGANNPALWPVQVGDFLQIQGGTPHMISTLTPPNTATLNSPNNPPNILFTADYRIIRSPRPVAGEDTIFLPDSVIIDLTPPAQGGLSVITPDLRPNGTINYDIMFSPGGPVIGPAGLNGQIILWVRDTTQPAATTPQQSFIVVFTRTGLIASYPVDTGSGKPYSYIQNPRAAGGL